MEWWSNGGTRRLADKVPVVRAPSQTGKWLEA
jgi:hypothetical protein